MVSVNLTLIFPCLLVSAYIGSMANFCNHDAAGSQIIKPYSILLGDNEKLSKIVHAVHNSGGFARLSVWYIMA